MKPFYYEKRDVWLLPITPQQADALFMDARLWYQSEGMEAGGWWNEDLSPEEYAEYGYSVPSEYSYDKYAIQVNPPEDEESIQL